MLEVSGLSKPTILKGIKELHSHRALGGEGTRIRRRGGGRKPIEEHDPEVTKLLEEIMEESTVGDPMSPLKWSSKSSYQIQQYLESRGHRISEDTVQRRLRKLDYRGGVWTCLVPRGDDRLGPVHLRALGLDRSLGLDMG